MNTYYCCAAFCGDARFRATILPLAVGGSDIPADSGAAIDASGRQQEEGMKRFETALDMLCVQLEGMLQQ